MQQIDLESHCPACIFAHELVNKLAVIVGRCQLIQDPAQSEEARSKHVSQIHEAAKSACEMLQHHNCQLVRRAQIQIKHANEFAPAVSEASAPERADEPGLPKRSTATHPPDQVRHRTP